MRSVCQFAFSFAFAAVVVIAPEASAAPAVWTGLTYSFSRPADVDGTLPQYQDAVTPNVWFARQSLGGLYNAATESLYAPNVSPEFTLWATPFNNPGAPLVAATEWESLNFTDWRTAYGGAGSLASNIVGANTVVYLTQEDIYLDLKFTSWAQAFGGGGAFSYLRAEASIVPEPAAWLLAAGGMFLFAVRRRRK